MSQQTAQNARLIYTIGVQHGLPPARARELVAAAFEESGLNPRQNNRAGSGAAGLFQLLSSGYVNRANKLGGVHNARANTLAILPDYVRYWKQHPGARPGQAAATVEASGEGAGFYSKDLGRFSKVGGGGAGPTGPSAPAAAQAAAPDRHEIAMQLIQTLGQDHPDVGALIPLVAAGRAASQAKAPQAHTGANRGDIGASTVGSVSAEDARVVQSAKRWLGTPYVYGGSSKNGIDCSALLQKIWADGGVKIARTTYDQWKQGTAVAKGQLRAGDAVFFRGSDARGNLPGHVGVYIGGGRFIEAPHTGARVRVSTLAGRTDFVGGRRYG